MSTFSREGHKAIEYYKFAIEKGEKLDSSIKDLASLYAQLYRSETDIEKSEELRHTASEFLAKHASSLAKSISTYNFLESIYFTLRKFDKFIEVVDTMLDEKEIITDKKRQSLLLSKKAAALAQVGKTDLALDVIDECVELDPSNTFALKLESTINEGATAEDIESVFSATSIDTLASNGLSPFIEQTLDDYDEYSGVPVKTIESKQFTKDNLKRVRELIDSFADKKFAGRSKDRARYLLTEGKLMQTLEPDNISRLKSVMAKYCNDMAKIHIYSSSQLDIIRFYYNEAFALEETYEGTARQISYYLLTHCYTYAELQNALTQSITIDKSLSLMMANGFDAKKWESMLSMFLYNREISAQIISKLYSSSTLKDQSIVALRTFGVDVNSIKSKDDFIAAWNSAREKRLRDYKTALATIKSLGDVSDIAEIPTQLDSLRKVRAEWMCVLDISRINNVINNITPAISNFIKSTGYSNKESNYRNCQGQIQQLIEEINDGPTRLSFEGILPLMHKVRELMEESFSDVIKMSEPRIKIDLLSMPSGTVIEEGNIVSLRLQVSNHKDSSPIREVSVIIESSGDVSYVAEDNMSYNAINGGESSIFKVKVKVSEKVIKDKAAAFNAVCKYKSGEQSKEYSDQLSLKLYSSEDFKPIPNPYAPIADGGPVPVDSKMFYGREEFISNIVDSIIKSPSKQIIIYGQKRCGKSSVMLHLRKQLEETGKTFCIFFSLGDIIQNLSEATFYHKILSSIKNELDDIEFDGGPVPAFDIPRLSEFKSEDEDNPLNTFTKYMSRFKKQCKLTSGWEDKNLVVMIDEFTYLYTEIKKGHISPSIMKQWKAVTQNDKAQFSVVLVGQDVVPSFKKEDYARNAFGVIQDIRLTYLKETPARDLIEKPILDENGNSRYIGDAVSRIIEYTSRNPYYIQIFCARLVDYMNSTKAIAVTEAEVNDVSNSFIRGDQALEEDKFDNLIRAGETEDLQEYPESEILQVLRAISLGSKNIGYCNRADIDALEDKEREDNILKHLEDREVLEKNGEDNYKIQVKLFQEWLLNH